MSGPADYYKDGDYNAICSMCGHKYKASELVEHWQGQKRCYKCWEPRQPQDFVRVIPDNPTPSWTQPDEDGTYVATCSLVDRIAVSGVGVAGCIVSGFRPTNLADYLDPLPADVIFASTTPVAIITAPLPGATAAKNDIVTITFNNKWFVSPVVSGSLTIDGVVVATGISGSYDWDTSTYTVGTHSIMFTVTDAVGKTGSDMVDLDLTGIVDPYFAHVAALYHFDTSPGLAVDSSSNARDLVEYGTGSFTSDSTVVKFGQSLLVNNGSATGDYLATNAVGTLDAGLIPAAEYTVEFWIRFLSWTSAGAMFTIGDYANGSAGRIYLAETSGTGGNCQLFHNTLGATFIFSSLNTWYHFALTRDASSVVRLFIDGVNIYSNTNATDWSVGMATSCSLQVGGMNFDRSPHANIDDFRYTNGVCRYTADFTPPTAAFPNY